MSNNARAAYEAGEMPLTKWTKEELLDAVNRIDSKKAEMLKTVPLQTLKEMLNAFILLLLLSKKRYKKEASQLKDAKGPNVTADTASEITSINIITDSSKKAIPKIKQISPAC